MTTKAKAKKPKAKTKLKTLSGAAKRFKVTGSGRVVRKKANLRHILTKKSSKRKRQLGIHCEVSKSDMILVRRAMPNHV